MSYSSDSSDDDLIDYCIIMSGYIIEDLFDIKSAKYSREYIQLLEQQEDYDQEGNTKVDSTKGKGPNRNDSNISDDYYANDRTSDEDSDTLLTPRLQRRKASKRTSKQNEVSSKAQLENLKEAEDRQRKIELEIRFLKERIEKKNKSYEEKIRQLDTSKMDEGQRKLHQKVLEKLKRDE